MSGQLYTEFKNVRDELRVFGGRDLSEEICRTAKQRNAALFAKFQLDTINQHFGGLSECLAVNILHMDGKMPDTQSLESVVAGCDAAVSDSYRAALITDTFTPMTFKRCGTAIFVHAVQSMDAWDATDIYSKHCRPCDLHWIVGLSYAVPHDKKTFLVFDYMSPKNRPFSSALHEAEIEYASYPFYLGWLYLHGRICAETLREHLKAYGSVGMNPLCFAVIRGMVGHRQFRTEPLATALGTSKKVIAHHMDAAFRNFADADTWEFDPDDDLGAVESNFGTHKTNRIAEIVDRFSLMQGGPGEFIRKHVAQKN